MRVTLSPPVYMRTRVSVGLRLSMPAARVRRGLIPKYKRDRLHLVSHLSRLRALIFDLRCLKS